MNTKWSLYVKDFGKINEATIEISPMMIFTGDNSSGKSYMMTLLWGLITQSKDLFEDIDITSLPSYDKCVNWIKSLDHEETTAEEEFREGLVSEETQKCFVDLFNEVLDIKKKIFVQDIFNGEVHIGELKIVDFKCKEIKYIVYKSNSLGFPDIGKSGLILHTDTSKLSMVEWVNGLISHICGKFIFRELITDYSPLDDALYFPAARTGFTLSYRTLLNGMMDSAFSSSFNKVKVQKSKSSFSEPIINFLRRWTNLGERNINESTAKIVTYIQQNLLKGQLETNDMPLAEMFFKPEEDAERIPMHMTSSLISEIAPIALFLKYEHGFKTIIIEEPEAHLQLSAQMIMARVLAKLLNAGFNVWITTHSDTLVQEINNLIKLNSLKDKENFLQEHTIEKEDCIDFKTVKVYEYRNTGSMSTVEPTKGNEEGYEYPQIAEAIHSQTNRLLEMESEADGD